MFKRTRRFKIDRELYDRLQARARAVGYSSVEELVFHVLEKEAERKEQLEADEDVVKRRLQGLGYID